MKWFSRWSLALLSVALSHSQVVVNAAYEEGRPLAPGSIAVLFGDFAAATPATADSLPLPNLLGGVEIAVDGETAGMYSVSKTQINFVVPARVEAGRQPRRVPVQLRIQGTPYAATITTLIQDSGPALFSATPRIRSVRRPRSTRTAPSTVKESRPGRAVR